METIEQLKRQLERERLARKHAELILEQKSLELYNTNNQLTELNNSLQLLMQAKTDELNFEQHPMPLILVRTDDLTITDLNEKTTEIFNCKKADLLKKKFDNWAQPDLNPEQPTDHPVNGERVIKVGNEKRYFMIHSTPLNFRNESIYLVMLYDLTLRKQLFQQYSEKEKAYRELVENVSDIIYRSDYTGKFVYVNPTAMHVTGYTEKELIGSHFTNLVREDFRAKLLSFYTFQMEEGIQSTYVEFPIITKNKKEIWIGQTVDLHKTDNGKSEFIALCRDISDRKKAEKALILSEDKYRSIIENLELGLLEVDKDGRIIKAYPQFCNLIGYTAAEMEGKMANDLLLNEEGKKAIETEVEKRKKGQSSVYELELIRKDGTSVWVIVSGAPFYNEKNEIAGTVGIHLDISARKKMEEDLIHAKEIAEKSLHSKDLFVANMSHEIRTPMNAIVGMSRLLADSGLTEKQRDYVHAIQTSSENLLTIVNDLLDFSKLEAGKMELELIPEDLNRAVATAAQLWDLRLDEKGLIFEKNIDNKLAGFYLFDPTRLNGILTNLLHNAFKFTRDGKITFNVKLEEQLENADRITFEVKDTGIGIPADKLAGIFESFTQAESSTTRKYGGTGLGLSIAKDFVKLMGGELHVASELGKGSRFYFTIQLEKALEYSKTEELHFDETLVAGLNVLLVEDNQINRFMARTILEQWKINVACAENGAEAVELLQDIPFDLVLMDMQMPVLDGLQATWIIRNKLNLDVPVIALTANAVKGEAEKCLEAGMNGFVSKPFKQEDLLKTMLTIMKENMNSDTENNLLAGKTLTDFTLLYQSTGGDDVFMKKMLELVISETEKKITEIRVLLDEENQDAVKRIVHSMKPSIDHVAIQEVRELLREVEKGSDSFGTFSENANLLLALLSKLVETLKTNELPG